MKVAPQNYDIRKVLIAIRDYELSTGDDVMLDPVNSSDTHIINTAKSILSEDQLVRCTIQNTLSGRS